MEQSHLLVDSQGRLYTGLNDGTIVRTKNSRDLEFEHFARTGENLDACGKVEFFERCGRPLGLKFDKRGDLIVADAYLGLLKIDFQSRNVEVLAKEGMGMVDALDIDEETGKIYFTDATTRYPYHHILLDLLDSKPFGKFFVYDPETKSHELLHGELYFPNGIALTRDRSALLITSTSRSLLLKFDLKTRELTTINDALQGIPDNIVARKNTNTYFIGCPNHRSAPFSLIHFLAPYPFLKKLLLWIPPQILFTYEPRFGLILEVDEQGQVIRSLAGLGPDIGFLTEAYEFNDKLLLGSFRNQFIGISSLE
jgi:sugar lactone lactonase YvrE